MTDPQPDPQLDELIAAYLDGETTAAERARVQDDPDLLARAEALRGIANLVAAPVTQPDHAVRDAHIDAALAASSTSPVVTAMPSRGDRSDLLRFASVAAVVLAIMVAVPVLLLAGGGGDDDDAATSAESADDGLAAMDAVTGGADGADGASEMPADEVGAVRSADDGEMAATESAADDTETASDPSAGETAEADAEEAFAEPLDDAALEAILEGVPRIDLDEAATPRDLRRQVTRRLAADTTTPAFGDEDSSLALDDLSCGPVLAAEAAGAGTVLAVGATVIDGTAVEYVLIDGPLSMVVVLETGSCVVVFAN